MLNQADHARTGLGPSVCGRCEDWPEETKAWQGDADADAEVDTGADIDTRDGHVDAGDANIPAYFRKYCQYAPMRIRKYWRMAIPS